ncbi:MAG: type II toxin-antitoxin system VapC family toxin, partial [Defluviitaleaceae bacterium]|nr:type II toxin-antitoxin system VapC family toxin [Defluviitaleaceae bacterium]
LWMLDDYSKLSDKANVLLRDDSNALYVSVATAWEVAIKTSLGKLPEFDGGVSSLFAKLEEMPIILLPIKHGYLEILETLPFFHRDPFDRLLIATAKYEDMTLLTADVNMKQYDVSIIW